MQLLWTMCTCRTRLIHWKLSSSVESGRCSATTTILSSWSTVMENTAILKHRHTQQDDIMTVNVTARRLLVETTRRRTAPLGSAVGPTVKLLSPAATGLTCPCTRTSSAPQRAPWPRCRRRCAGASRPPLDRPSSPPQRSDLQVRWTPAGRSWWRGTRWWERRCWTSGTPGDISKDVIFKKNIQDEEKMIWFTQSFTRSPRRCSWSCRPDHNRRFPWRQCKHTARRSRRLYRAEGRLLVSPHTSWLQTDARDETGWLYEGHRSDVCSNTWRFPPLNNKMIWNWQFSREIWWRSFNKKENYSFLYEILQSFNERHQESELRRRRRKTWIRRKDNIKLNG